MTAKILFILLMPLLAFSQKFERNVFDYDKLAKDGFPKCDYAVKQQLEWAYVAVEENHSAKAVKIAKELYDSNSDCIEAFETYGFVLFRSGEWFDGLEIIEKGIRKFGSVPELIRRKYQMSLEMAELGTGKKNIDGNSVYKANSLNYDAEEFKNENLKSALIDLEYLMTDYNRNEEIYYAAKINQVLKNYDKSTQIFETLLKDDEFSDTAIFNIADNYTFEGKFTEAESELNKLLVNHSKDGGIYTKFAELYEKKNEKTKAVEFKNKAIYYNNIPGFSKLGYSKENLDLLLFFASDENEPVKKLNKINDIFKADNQAYTVEICLLILKLHTNHGNGVEDRATEILIKIGKPAIENVNLLFQSDVSTCTITNLAQIMATVKDESSWSIMKEYLAYIANMPMTIIPPSLPEQMIAFNEDRGITEILTVVKPLLTQETNAMAFGQYVYYSPLKEIDKAKLKKIATGLNYSDKEFELLQQKIN